MALLRSAARLTPRTTSLLRPSSVSFCLCGWWGGGREAIWGKVRRQGMMMREKKGRNDRNGVALFRRKGRLGRRVTRMQGGSLEAAGCDAAMRARGRAGRGRQAGGRRSAGAVWPVAFSAATGLSAQGVQNSPGRGRARRTLPSSVERTPRYEEGLGAGGGGLVAGARAAVVAGACEPPAAPLMASLLLTAVRVRSFGCVGRAGPRPHLRRR